MAANAHEAWLSVESYQVAEDAPIVADIRVGQQFKGAAYSYIPQRTERFDIVMDGTATEVTSRTGDQPAMSMTAPNGGLAILVHETNDSTLRWDAWEKFETFVTHKDASWTLEEHKKRGLPEVGFVESYRRYMKSLVAVGDGAGSDLAVGLDIEIVALANPYKDDISDGLPVRVLLYGEPRPEAQIELFAKGPDGEVAVTLHQTDSDGVALLPAVPGTEYLVDSVSLEPKTPEDPAKDPVWRSLWASLTFRVPN